MFNSYFWRLNTDCISLFCKNFVCCHDTKILFVFQSQISGLTLWPPGVIPPALIAFEGHVHPIDPMWHVAGLGHRFPEVPLEIVEAAAVIHFSGPAKPWLEIGSPEVRGLWNKHVNCSNKFIRRCKIMG